ncbi:MAG: ABC transporter ATP-binding protein [Planctomycetota bacterium]|nr:ABC transporter ATP-binding protein [Planctomycetota bacterium]
MNDNLAVELKDVGVRYRLSHERATTLKETVINFLLGRRYVSEDLWALRNVNLEIEKGTCVGVIGRNGCGKSTLLQVVAKVIGPTEGEVSVRGDISSLLQLGAGFDPELSGTDNVFLSGSLQGLSRRAIHDRYPEIVEFSGLGSFIDVPVKNFSAGMYVRLGFSIAITVDPDVLLIDEALAVGDEAFQQKCLEKIRAFRDSGKTLLIVSHGLDLLATLCDRVVLLDRGQIVSTGEPRSIIDQYHQMIAAADGVDVSS